jgi:putative peptidoglycan lipid II flippase
VVYLVFRHGNYSEAASQNSAQALAFFSIGMFAWAGQQFIARGLYALQDTKTPTIIGTLLTFFFFLPLCWIAARSSEPIIGLALATSIGACAHFCGVWWALERKLEQMQHGVSLKSERVLGTILRTLSACVVMGVVGEIAKNLCDAFLPQDHLNHFFRILFISPVALMAFALASQKFRIPEYFWLRDKLLGRFLRRRAK